jgi:DNA-directed RNA polymerase specialized sigma24 family protein
MTPQARKVFDELVAAFEHESLQSPAAFNALWSATGQALASAARGHTRAHGLPVELGRDLFMEACERLWEAAADPLAVRTPQGVH